MRNTGDVTFKNVLVKDNPAPDCGGYITSKGYFSDEFPPNEEFTYTCTVKNVKKEFVNTATVTGEYADGSSCQDRTRSARSARV